MAEPDFHAASRDIEEHLAVPEFDQVVDRGHTIRRRRRTARVAAAAAAVVAVVGVAVAIPFTDRDDPPPVATPPGDEVAALLRDPAATVDGTATRIADTGDVEAWQEDVAGRAFTEVPGGFLVGAPEPACRAALPEETATGRLLDPGELRIAPNDSAQPVARDGNDVWARSVDAATLSWSTDGGQTWASHETTLDGPNLQVAAAGDRAVFVDWPTAEVTADHGEPGAASSWVRCPAGSPSRTSASW